MIEEIDIMIKNVFVLVRVCSVLWNTLIIHVKGSATNRLICAVKHISDKRTKHAVLGTYYKHCNEDRKMGGKRNE
jgi:hypothetical protein